jgi:hypothetical protein
MAVQVSLVAVELPVNYLTERLRPNLDPPNTSVARNSTAAMISSQIKP